MAILNRLGADILIGLVLLAAAPILLFPQMGYVPITGLKSEAWRLYSGVADPLGSLRRCLRPVSP